MIVGQGPIAFAVGAGGGGLDIFTLLYPFSPLSPPLGKTARYRLKYCLKGPLNPKQSNPIYPLEYNHDTSQLCRIGHNDVSRTSMTTLVFILPELFPLDGFRCNFVPAQ